MRHVKLGLMALAGAVFLSTVPIHPAWSAPDAALFGQLPEAHDAAISPDGTQIAILQNYDGNYLVNIIEIAKSKARQEQTPRFVGLGEGVMPDYLKWIDNDRLIVSVSETKMIRSVPLSFGFLHLIDTNTLEAKFVIESPRRGRRQFNNQVLDWLEDDPDHIIMQFAGDRREQIEVDVRRVEVASGKSKIIKRYQFGVRSWVTDGNGNPRVGVGYRKDGTEAFILIEDPETGEWETAEHYPGIDPETMEVVAVTEQGRSLVMSAYRGKDTRGLHRYDLVKKEWGEALYQNEKYDVRNVILSKDGNDIVGVSFTGETTERVLFDSYNSTYEESLDAFKGFQTTFVDQTSDSDTLLVRVSAPNQPGGLFMFERGGQITGILPNLTGLSVRDMGKVISKDYASRDGEMIQAFLTLPPSVPNIEALKGAPTIVLPHGGPYSRDSKRFDWFAQFFATRGYLVLQMNFRGSAGFGKSFADAGRNSWVVMQEDVEDGMNWLVNQGYSDPNKTCIAGWSYGGYAALMGAIKTPDLYRCSIAIAALSDIPEAVSDAKKFVNGGARAERTFGVLMDDRALMRANNPVDHAKEIKVPVFMAHGENDAAVEFDQYEAMKRRLEKAGVDGTYMSFEDEDHYMSTQANRQAMLEGIETFLLKVNGESPLIVK